MRTGGIVYTGAHGPHAHLIFCETSKLLAPHERAFARGHVYLRDDPFWSFARPHINRHHRISPRWFPIYLAELLFRYNTPSDDFRDEVIRCLCGFTPGREPPSERAG